MKLGQSLVNNKTMKKIILTLIISLISTVSFAGMSNSDKSKTIECTGIYYANSMIPQGELELEKIVQSFAAKIFLNSHLIKEGVEEEKLNKEILKIVDIRYGKPYDEETTRECDNFIFKLIPLCLKKRIQILPS